MAKNINIEIPDDLYGSLQMLSHKKNIRELNNVINNILKAFIDERKKRMNDPFFLPISEKGSGISDISDEHDKYIYGK